MAENPVSLSQLFDATGPGRQEIDELGKSVAALSRHVKSLSKNLDSDAQRIAAGLAAIVGQTAALREQTSKINVLNEQERAGLAALGSEVAKLAQQQLAAQQAAAGQAKVQAVATDAAKQATAQLKLLQNALREAYATADAGAIVKAANDIKAYKDQTDQLNRALRGANSELTAVAGSYNRLSLETQQLGQTIRALPGGFDATSEEAQKLKAVFYANTQQLKDFDRELNENFREVGAYARGIIEAVGALNSQKNALTAQISALKMQANATHLSAEQQGLLRAEIDKTEIELRKVTGELNTYGTAAAKGGKQSAGFSASVGGMAQNLVGTYLGITALTGALSSTFSKVAEYSDQVTDVRKTTGLSADATDRLTESLKKVDTRTTLAGLLDIAQVGGQLGVAGKDIEGFTKAVDVSVQALGDEFTGGAEQIATELGKIAHVFKADLGPDIATNLLDIGSAVNQIGADGAATSPFLTDVALRVGQLSAQYRVGLPNVLAYAAVLEESGSTAERAGTSLNRLFSTIAGKTEASFKIAQLADSNLTLKEFTHLVNTDFNGAIQLFLKGLNAGGTSTTRVNQLLGTLKLQSGEAKSTILALAQNTEIFAERQATANEQLRTGASVAAEAALKNDNLAGSWAKLKNDVANFFTSGTGASALKWFVDAARGALNLRDGLGKTFGLVKDVSASEALLEASRKQVQGLTDTGQAASFAAARAAQLYETYQSLAGATELSVAQQQTLNRVTLQLRDVLGEKVVVIDKETGALKLNTGAVELAIAAQGKLKTAQAATLAQQLQTIDAQLLAAKTLQTLKSNEVDTRLDLAGRSGVNLNNAEKITENIGRRITSANVAQVTPATAAGLGVTQPQVAALVALREANDGYGQAINKVKGLEAQRAVTLAGLLKLGYSATESQALLTAATGKEAQATDDSTAADKKKKQAVADVLKAQLELRKFQLEEQAKDFDRQAANVANPDDVRTRAIEQASARRKEIARLDAQEAEHEAVLKNAKLVGGDQALAVERQTIHAQFLAKIRALGLNADQQLLALAQHTADQLAALDKVQLEAEATDLERTAADENKSYQEREQAALDASARRIEIILIESDVKRRAAKGDARELARIQADQEAATTAALRTTRSPNADLANNDLDKRNQADQLALETSLGGKLSAERAYVKESERLEDELLSAKLRNLLDDPTKAREAAELKLQIQKRANERELKLEQDKQQQKLQIIQQAAATAQAFSDAFFQIGNDQRAAELADLQASKDKELTAAGDNAELKAKINEDYAARELAAKRKQAQYDKAQALFSVALNTAMAVTSVLSTGGGTRYADFGISAGILSALVIASGVAQAVAIAAKPLPAYYKGRAGGPAEYAHLAERGPELVGQPGSFRVVARQAVGYLEAGDRVFTAPETRQVLAQNDLVEGRIVQRQQGQDQERQARQLQSGAQARQAAERAAAHQSTDRLEKKLEQVRKAIHEQEYQRLNEQDDLVRRRHNEQGWQDLVNRRYKGGKG